MMDILYSEVETDMKSFIIIEVVLYELSHDFQFMRFSLFMWFHLYGILWGSKL